MDHKSNSKCESHNLRFGKKDCDYQGLSWWPQRNFMCTFCNKECKSAQALGGHMNIHRRDRARLRLSSPPSSSVDHHHPNSNVNPNLVSRPSPIRYKTHHSSLVSATTSKDKQQKLPLTLFALSGRDLNLSEIMEDEEQEENETRVWKKIEVCNMKMEMGLLKDGKIDHDLDLELRLGRS